MGIVSDNLAAHHFKTDIWGLIKAIGSSPGFWVIGLYQISSFLYKRKILRPFHRLPWWLNIVFFGCYISPLAKIGRRMCFPHPVGVVIGDGVVVGNDCTIYQGVTVGVASGQNLGYAQIGSGTVVYASAIIIGNINIGDSCCIGANSLVRNNVPAGQVYAGNPARFVRLNE